MKSSVACPMELQLWCLGKPVPYTAYVWQGVISFIQCDNDICILFSFVMVQWELKCLAITMPWTRSCRHVLCPI